MGLERRHSLDQLSQRLNTGPRPPGSSRRGRDALGSVSVRQLRFSRPWIAIGWLLVAGVTTASLVTVPVEAPAYPFVDKLLHLLAYLVVMGWFAQIWSSRGTLAAHAGGLIALGIALELVQGSLSHRSADAFDAIANALGVVLGTLTTRPPESGLLERLEAWLTAPP